MSLSNKYRPSDLRELVGYNDIKLNLYQKIKNKKLPRSILITGISGIGKTTLGRIITELVGTDLESPDYKELNASDFRGVDTIRQVIKESKIAPMCSEKKVWFLDECHMLTHDAQEALLKALENATVSTLFILGTSEPKKLKTTFKRRCLNIELKPLEDDIIFNHLKDICKEEEIKIHSRVLSTLVKNSKGSIGQAISRLEKLTYLGEEEQEEAAKEVEEIENNNVVKLLLDLVNKSSLEWQYFQKTLLELQKENPETVRRQIIGFCNGCLLKHKNVNPIYLYIYSLLSHPTYDNGFVDITTAIYQVWLKKKEGRLYK